MFGACCLRKRSAGLSKAQRHHTQHRYNISSVNRTLSGYEQLNMEDETWYRNIDFNHSEDLKRNPKRVDCRTDLDFTYTCDDLTLTQCQALVKDHDGEAQVLSFSPGLKCSDRSCGGRCGCFSQRRLWRYGERFSQGCEECTCTGSGRVDCVCRHLTQRKEIRDLTLRERRLYQRAIGKLYASSGKAGNPHVFIP